MAQRNGSHDISTPTFSNRWTGPQKPRRPRPKRRFPPEVLSQPEVAALMGACSDGPAGIRNRAMIAVLYRAGLRITEALLLHPKDVDAANGAIRVLHAKGGRSRTVGMDRAAFEVLQRWMDVRAERVHSLSAPLFCMIDGSPLYSSYIRVLLPRLGRKAGLAKRIHAHGLRHTHAAELRGEGVDIGIISKQLGHTTISTTARYLDHIAPLAVIESMSRSDGKWRDPSGSQPRACRRRPRGCCPRIPLLLVELGELPPPRPELAEVDLSAPEAEDRERLEEAPGESDGVLCGLDWGPPVWGGRL